MSELDQLEVWIRENIEDPGFEDGVFNDGYVHALYMVLKQMKKMRQEVKA